LQHWSKKPDFLTRKSHPYLNRRELDFSPYIDRDLTFAETLDDQEAQRYNVIAELLGMNPVQRLNPEAGLNREAIINAMIAQAGNAKTASDQELARRKTDAQKRAYEEERIRKENREGVPGLFPEMPKADFGKTIPKHKQGTIVPLPKKKRKKTVLDKAADWFSSIF